MNRRLVTCALVCGMLATPASAIELLMNGDFEQTVPGNAPTGWTLFQQAGSIGQFYTDAPGSELPSFDPGFRLDMPDNNLSGGGGRTYAVSAPFSITDNSVGAGTHVLSQTFSLPGNATSLRLRYQFFAIDLGNLGDLEQPSGLDYTTGGTFDPNDTATFNQLARIEVLRGGASPFSTNAADIVTSSTQSFKGVQTRNQEWEQRDIDLTGNLQFGQNYTVRFAVVSNGAPVILGVDNVSLDFIGRVIIPEAGTGWLALIPGAVLLIRRRLRV